jgi:hypothetical protein
MVPTTGAAAELLTALFGVLHADSTLSVLLGADPDDPRIYQAFVAFDTAVAIRNKCWITFNVTSDLPTPAEQTHDIRDIGMDIHVWVRDPDGDKADAIARRVAYLLEEGSETVLTTATLFVWMFHPTGYTKTFDADQEVWHTVLGYHGMMMAMTT